MSDADGEHAHKPGTIVPGSEVARAVDRGLAYLRKTQRPDGSWLPLWFGNQHLPDDENPVYGTARVLMAYRDLGRRDAPPARAGFSWLLAAQHADGSWGGPIGGPGTVEETALAVDALDGEDGSTAAAARERGLEWLVGAVLTEQYHNARPIGFYFAKLWYYEKLYPPIFTVAALGRALLKAPCRP